MDFASLFAARPDSLRVGKESRFLRWEGFFEKKVIMKRFVYLLWRMLRVGIDNTLHERVADDVLAVEVKVFKAVDILE